jgi:hypothetical protein
MWRIKTPTRQIGKFPINPPPGSSRDAFTNGNPAVGLASTQLEADWFDMVQEEIANCIELSGEALQLPVADGSTYNQLHRAIGRIAGGPYLPLTGGTLSGPGTLTIAPGGQFHVPIGIDYTGLPSGFPNLIGFDWDGTDLRAYVDGTLVGGVFREPPDDATIYGRVRAVGAPVGAWAQVSVGGGGIPDAPIDNFSYMRVNATWLSSGTLAGALGVTGNLSVTGGTNSITGALSVGNGASIANGCAMDWAVVSGTRTVTPFVGLWVGVGGAQIDGPLTTSANAEIGVNLTVNNAMSAVLVTADTAVIVGDLAAGGDLVVTGQVRAGFGAISASLTVGTDLGVTSNLTVGTGAQISGATGALRADGGAQIGNGINGINCLGGLSVAGNVVLPNDGSTISVSLSGDRRGMVHTGQLAFGGIGADGNPTPGQTYALMTAGPTGLGAPQDFGGLFTVPGQAFKWGTGEWVVLPPLQRGQPVTAYTSGLAEIRRLAPIRNDQGYIGLIVEDAAEIMPELTCELPPILRSEGSGSLALDSSALKYALVNAVKELADRLDALEGRR